MKYEKYYKLIEEQSKIFDKTQNCQIGQTWKYHLLPVIQNACMLADKYGADKDVVEVSAIFHDYADLLDFANRDNHHILGAELAEGILSEDNFPQEFINKVKLCIKNHRASVVKEKFSIEEICVADADAISHLDNVVELICWRAYLGEDIMTCNNFVKKKIEKSYAKMSNETKDLMKEKYESIMKILF
ncbi:MAG: HD domain-containing protein [Clostridiales bacterium]|nr:HD domain-containing protein [Clostridiales bacterium]